MSWASSRLTSSRALTSISRKLTLGWDAFQAVMSRRICSLTSLRRFSSFMGSLLFLLAFPKEDAFPYLCCLASTWGLLSSPPHSTSFCALCLPPMQKNDGHPHPPLLFDNSHPMGYITGELYSLLSDTKRIHTTV